MCVYVCVCVCAAGTHEPITVREFPEHVKRMHANDDFLFTEEYHVSGGLGGGANRREKRVEERWRGVREARS